MTCSCGLETKIRNAIAARDNLCVDMYTKIYSPKDVVRMQIELLRNLLGEDKR